MASIDWDFDGDVDVLLTNRTGPRFRVLINTGDMPNRSVQFRMQGVGANRQGIGARVLVELQAPDGTKSTLMRSLHAGHGFLSQSSNWLHFGLGKASTISQVAVQWPGGTRQQVSGVDAGGRFLLVQGQTEAQRWVPPKRTQQPFSSVNGTPPLQIAAQIRLQRPIPLPPLSLSDRKGNSIALNSNRTGPLLLNLWATWCGPCREELAELAQRADDLRSHGLDVVAVSVEGAMNGVEHSEVPTLQPSVPAIESQSVLAELGFPFRSAIANTDLMNGLHLTHRVLFVRPTKIPIPTSLLIDAHGRVAIIYRGRVSVDQILNDVQALVDPNDDVWRDYCRPFAVDGCGIRIRSTTLRSRRS